MEKITVKIEHEDGSVEYITALTDPSQWRGLWGTTGKVDPLDEKLNRALDDLYPPIKTHNSVQED